MFSPQDPAARGVQTAAACRASASGAVRGKSLCRQDLHGAEDKSPLRSTRPRWRFRGGHDGVSTSAEMLSMLGVALAGKKDKGGGASLRATLSKALSQLEDQRVAMGASLSPATTTGSTGGFTRHKKDSDEAKRLQRGVRGNPETDLSGFQQSGINAVNYSDLGDMGGWEADDRRLPCPRRASLAMIGDESTSSEDHAAARALLQQVVVFRRGGC
ncbi:hypothetical protein Q5P01_000784 [Channa striata]|uniref:Uncharacterized protein n=1 Tax=Channa striata TaxID=64152 RepID=A0AA88IWY9_CHASR|nr:hypothetical protein Q5P01_000784 [Channa striata]